MEGFQPSTSMKRGAVAQVVMLPEGAVGEAVLDRVELWTGEGLLDAAFWVPARSVKGNSTVPARVTAVVMGATSTGEIERREVPLLATLGRETFDEIVVSSVRWLSDQVEDRAIVSEAARRLLAAIRDSMPFGRPVGALSVHGTTVRSLNLVFAATQVKSDEIADLLSTDWEENIVVSPEDRQRPCGADRFTDVEDIDTWASFVTASAATLAGLWTGFVSSPVPRTTGSEAALAVPRVRVARTFTRAVVSGAFTVHLARTVATALADPHTPLSDPIIASQIDQMHALVALNGSAAENTIASAVAYLARADSGALTYQAVGDPPDYQRTSVGFFGACGDFIRFSWDKLRAIPTWIGAWFADRAGTKTEGALFGDAADVTVDVRTDLGIAHADRDLLDITLAIDEMQARVNTALAQPPLPVTRPSVPTLWNALRSTIFTLVDGRTDSADTPPVMIDGRIAIVPEIGMVIPAPWDTWHLPSDAARHLTGSDTNETVVSWTELAAARELLEHLTERAADLEARHQELEAKHAKSRISLITAERDFVESRELWEDVAAELDEAEEAARLYERVPAGVENE